jgi:crotonobetainyl-CoA:carnitine CoA-transferase CaiB-like acyl-CoA transferase
MVPGNGRHVDSPTGRIVRAVDIEGVLDMLSPYRVLDLTDERGQLAGYTLASLGADVILVEPPEGSGSRRLPPFAGGVEDRERSLVFHGWNRGKRSVVIDLDDEAGRAELTRLAGDADVVLESGGRRVDLAALRAANPALITVSISPYGSTGPKADWPATDLTVLAAGCQLAMTGDADRPPVRTSAPQAFLHAAADAAAGVLLALTERASSGLGQHVDISAQRSMLQATQSCVLAVPLGASPAERSSGGVRAGGLDVRLRWPCKDGFVSITYLFGDSMGPFTRRLMNWIHEEGYCDEATRDKDWIAYAAMLYDGREPISEYERLKQVVEDFCLTKTKAELLEAARSKILLIAPVAGPDDVVESVQFAVRDFWDEVVDPLLADRAVPAPGPFAWGSDTPVTRLGRAPRLGEHTEEVLAAPTRAASAAPVASESDRRLPLDGINVLDLTWAMSGPQTTRVMADFGASVVRVESTKVTDVARTVAPFLNDVPGAETSGLLFNMGAGKRSITLNLRSPEGHAVLEDLIRWADVLIESFSPRGGASLGLDYQRVSTINPDIVMMSSCLFGHSGPLAQYAGFGTMGASLTGFFHLTGWPDRPPCGPFGAYTDYMSPRFALCTLLAALDVRRRTGRGQYFDFAQAESAVHFLTPALLDYAVNRNVQRADGNADPVMVPHGIYPSAGDDQWVAVACRDDADWRALAGAIGGDDLTSLNVDQRRARARELDALVASWTSGREPAAAASSLLALGVPAHAVQNSGECAADEQLRSQDHFVEVPHAEHGTVVVEGSRISLSATPATIRRGPPVLGEHTVDVVTELLGYDDERLGMLLGAGALD